MPQAALKPAATKLPLAVRKNVRDEWEAKRPEFEKQLSDILGVPWTITADVNLIYANVSEEIYSSRLGEVISWYIEPLVRHTQRFLEKYGEDGKQELNSLVSSHSVAFGPQDSSTDFSYGGLVVEKGALRLVYNAPEYFASNVGDVSMEIAEALKTASLSSEGGGRAYDIIARNSVRENYDPKVEETRKRIATLTGAKGVVLKPNFEENAEVLSRSKDTREDWARILGEATLAYFDGFAYQLERAGFKDDDMLQEGFQDAVTKGEISLRVVSELESGYHNVKVEDGTLLIHTTPATWWVNMDDVGSKILDIL